MENTGIQTTLTKSEYEVRLGVLTYEVEVWHTDKTVSPQTDVRQTWKVKMPSGRQSDDSAHLATVNGYCPTTAAEAERLVLAVVKAGLEDPYCAADQLGLTDQASRLPGYGEPCEGRR